MTAFQYKGVDANGQSVAGEVTAASSDSVVATLLGRGVTPIEILPANDRSPGAALPSVDSAAPRQHRASWWRWRGRSIGAPELLDVIQSLATLLKAGVVIDRAIAIQRDLSSRAAVKDWLASIHTQVREGQALSNAMAERRGVVPPFCIAMIRAGEVGGVLAPVLERLGQLLERTERIRQRVRSALIYPVILAVMILSTLFVVVGIVLPRFEQLFTESQIALPWATRAVLAMGRFLQSLGGYILAILLLGSLVLWQRLKHENFRLRWDAFWLKRAFVGDMIRHVETSRLLRTLGTLLGNGVPPARALRVAQGVLGNRALAAATDSVLQSVREGQTLSSMLAKAAVYPTVAVQLTRVGEESGRLDGMLLQVADVLDRQVEQSWDRTLATVVPLITIAMGALVAMLIGSVLIGILRINDLAL